MAWLESHQELANHPKTRRLKRLLGISTAQAVGHLHLLWWWSMDYAPDGDLSTFEPGDIADACEWEGDARLLVDSLEEAGFLDRDCCVHDWDQYGGKYLKRREQSRVRQQRYRDEQGRYEAGSNASVTRYPNVTNGAVTPLQDKRRQDKTGENHTNAPAARVREKYPADFEEFWKRYPSGHGNKKAAAAQWARLSVEDRRAAEWGIEKWLRCDRWKRGMVKAGEIWLRDRWWEDEPPEGIAQGNGPQRISLDDLDRAMEKYGGPHGNGDGAQDSPGALPASKALGTGR